MMQWKYISFEVSIVPTTIFWDTNVLSKAPVIMWEPRHAENVHSGKSDVFMHGGKSDSYESPCLSYIHAVHLNSSPREGTRWEVEQFVFVAWRRCRVGCRLRKKLVAQRRCSVVSQMFSCLSPGEGAGWEVGSLTTSVPPTCTYWPLKIRRPGSESIWTQTIWRHFRNDHVRVLFLVVACI